DNFYRLGILNFKKSFFVIHPNVPLQAFVDDFLSVAAGDSDRGLGRRPSEALEIFKNWSDRYYLQILIESVHGWHSFPAEFIKKGRISSEEDLADKGLINIFTDGSRSELGVGTAFCILDEQQEFH
ncbi:hypothetical protein AVEN_115826-1, partial [Araneus ventricosus]